MVQAGLNTDLERLVVLGGEETVVLHWPTATRGYFGNARYEAEGELDWATGRVIYAAMNKSGRAVFKRLSDLLQFTFEEVDAVPLEYWTPFS